MSVKTIMNQDDQEIQKAVLTMANYFYIMMRWDVDDPELDLNEEQKEMVRKEKRLIEKTNQYKGFKLTSLTSDFYKEGYSKALTDIKPTINDARSSGYKNGYNDGINNEKQKSKKELEKYKCETNKQIEELKKQNTTVYFTGDINVGKKIKKRINSTDINQLGFTNTAKIS